MKLKDYVATHPPKNPGLPCKVCTLPKNLLAEVNAALACGDQRVVVWRWLRFDQRQSISDQSVRRHAQNCLKLRKRS